MLLKPGCRAKAILAGGPIAIAWIGIVAGMPIWGQTGCTNPTTVPTLNAGSGTWPFYDPNALISNSATIGGSASVTFQAGNCINLRPGFRATAGSALITFRAFIGVAAPTISTLSSYSGSAGSSIVISGANFGTSQGTSTVTFNSTPAMVTNWSGSSITTTVPAGAGTGPVVVTVSGIASNGVTFAVVPPPVISGLLPSSGPAGSVFTILGSNFGAMQGSSIAQFNGAGMAIANWTDTSIMASVPAGAVNGSVVVTVAGRQSNGVAFAVTPSPSISGLSAYTGFVGMAVTVQGSNFGTQQGVVSFGGVPSTISNWTSTSIATTVPFAAATGNVVVTVNGANSNGVLFSIPTQPSIQKISPNFGGVGTAVTILGTNFGVVQGAGSVKFGAVTATAMSWNESWIIVQVPAGANSGPITVTANSQSATSAQSFTVNTATGVNIYSVQPAVANIGRTATITGTNFGTTQGSSKVRVNGTEATAIKWTNTAIDFAIPAGATGGDVVVEYVPGTGSPAATGSVNRAAITSSRFATSVTSNPGEIAVPGGGPAREYIRMGGRVIAIENPIPTVLPNVTGLSASSGTAAAASLPLHSAIAAAGKETLVAQLSTCSSNSQDSGTLTVCGNNFGASQGSSQLRFNGKAAIAATNITSWSNTAIVTTVPAGATTGNVVVTVSDLTGTGQAFTVTTTVPTLSIDPTGVEMTYLGGSGTFAVSSNINSWTATSDVPWLKIQGATNNILNGSLNGTVSYTVDLLCGATRPGHITFPGTSTVFTVTQNASPGLTISPSEVWDVQVAMTRQFYAFSCGGSSPLPNSALTWSISPVDPQYGSVNSAGVYSAPGSISLPMDASLHVQYQGQTASAVVHLNNYYWVPSGITVQPYYGVGSSQQFQFMYTVPAPHSYPPNVNILISSDTSSLANSCYLLYAPSQNNQALRLYGDDGTSFIQSTTVPYGFQPAGLYGSGFGYNTQCQMDLYYSWHYFNQSARMLYWNIPMYFEPGYAGGKHVFVMPDIAGAGWTRIGDWTAPTPGTIKPTVAIVSPAANATVSGTITISGWALDNATRPEGSISSVAAYLDGVPLGTATYGQASNICATYPGRPGCPNVGFTLQWDTHYANGGYVSNGSHTLMIVATDSDQPVNLRTVATQVINVSN